MGIQAIPIIGDLINMGSTWIQGKNERLKIKEQAKAKAAQSKVEHKEAWELAALTGAGWRDDYLTLLISIPLIACFVPGGAQWVVDGFNSLHKTPDWYPSLLMVVFGATFGRKELPKVLKNFKEAIKS